MLLCVFSLFCDCFILKYLISPQHFLNIEMHVAVFLGLLFFCRCKRKLQLVPLIIKINAFLLLSAQVNLTFAFVCVFFCIVLARAQQWLWCEAFKNSTDLLKRCSDSTKLQCCAEFMGTDWICINCVNCNYNIVNSWRDCFHTKLS